MKTDLEMSMDANRGLRAVQNCAYTPEDTVYGTPRYTNLYEKIKQLQLAYLFLVLEAKGELYCSNIRFRVQDACGEFLGTADFRLQTSFACESGMLQVLHRISLLSILSCRRNDFLK